MIYSSSNSCLDLVNPWQGSKQMNLQSLFRRLEDSLYPCKNKEKNTKIELKKRTIRSNISCLVDIGINCNLVDRRYFVYATSATQKGVVGRAFQIFAVVVLGVSAVVVHRLVSQV